jgi:hypothetical protein
MLEKFGILEVAVALHDSTKHLETNSANINSIMYFFSN